MVDEIKNDIENEEDNFPSFLSADHQENDIDHFLDAEGDISSAIEDPINLGAWNDGFEDEEKNGEDIDLNLENVKLDLSGWDDIEEDNFLKNPEDINIDTDTDLDVFTSNITSEESEDETPSIIPEVEMVENTQAESEPDITNVESQEDDLLDIPSSTADNEPKEVKYVDPEDYMGSNLSLEELSTEETLMEEYAEQEVIIPADSIRKASPKSLGNTFIDDLPVEEYEGAVSLIVPIVKHAKEMSGPDAAVTTTHKKKEEAKILMCQKYAGSIKDIYFEFSVDCQETAFAGNAVQNSIYINIGTSAYGWNVAFDNGVSMNLTDVRIYQLRNGRLPSDSGTLSFGSKKLRFSKVERIVYSGIPEYFHYGM